MDDVRAATALAQARPAYAAGLRAALATAAPLLLDHLFHTGGGTWMSVAGFLGALADKGGPYRTRAETIGALTLGSAAAVALGTIVREHVPLAVAVALAVAVVAIGSYLMVRHEELPPGVIRAGDPLKLKLEFAFPAAQR